MWRHLFSAKILLEVEMGKQIPTIYSLKGSQDFINTRNFNLYLIYQFDYSLWGDLRRTLVKRTPLVFY